MHIPVLLNEVVESLDPQPGEKFIDATIDGGGHARKILEQISPDGKLLGIELDDVLFKSLKVDDFKFSNNLVLINDSYVNLKTIAEENGFTEADGVLFDLGLSSWHLDESGKGFSFNRDEFLDMRYGSEGETAADILNTYPEKELAEMIKNYGEEKFDGRIARVIVEARKVKQITSTFQLVEIIKNAVPFWYRSGGPGGRRIHFATRTFQALRIAVNHELENVESGLRQAEEVLKKGGRLAVISFHSLEDRIAKNFLRTKRKEGKFTIITKKPIRAGLIEIEQNPRARSAKLRVAIKV